MRLFMNVVELPSDEVVKRGIIQQSAFKPVLKEVPRAILRLCALRMLLLVKT